MTAPSTPALPQMTLREWYAGQALVAMGTWTPGDYNSQIAFGPHKLRAEYAVRQADAMIAALKETGDA